MVKCKKVKVVKNKSHILRPQQFQPYSLLMASAIRIGILTAKYNSKTMYDTVYEFLLNLYV
jgi:hypothetical protein